MRCPRCHHENREEARFCAACGGSLAARCPACGHQPLSGAAFCDHCGTSLTGTTAAATRPPLVPRPQTPQVSTPPYLVEKILQSRTALEGERKQVTVLFADLKGSMELLAARMEQMAMPGSVLITAEVLRLAEGYVQVDPLGPVPIKGLPAPAEVHEVTGAGLVRSRLQAAAARGLTRFVGRDTELDQLRHPDWNAPTGRQGHRRAAPGAPRHRC